ncbi:hypothetical protein [Myceligenerans crystallogenes]|uniref:Uncharacterized protein n=1 Tax=Myceligenerans crystallogenes TaxID=316335 RepID=A0ABP4ZEK4_9MICO
MKITLQPGRVCSLDTVAVAGNGFTADASVTVELRTPDGHSILSHRTSADHTGAFATVLVVPEVREGTDCTVIATDPLSGATRTKLTVSA